MSTVVNYYSVLANILLSIKRRIIKNGLFKDNTCFISLLEDLPPNMPFEEFLIIKPDKRIPEQKIIAGAGNIAMSMELQFSFIMWHRLNLDQLSRDQDYLTSNTLGILQKWDDLISCLQQFFPQDETGQKITTEPIHLYEDVVYARANKDNIGWGCLKGIGKTFYTQKINSNLQK